VVVLDGIHVRESRFLIHHRFLHFTLIFLQGTGAATSAMEKWRRLPELRGLPSLTNVRFLKSPERPEEFCGAWDYPVWEERNLSAASVRERTWSLS
jgi:hypothetical protein